MTRTELVKKLTSYAAVDETYAASFMESFLLLLHQKLLENDSFTLPFHVTFSQKKVVRNNEEFYLITCHSSDPSDTQSEDLVFAVPSYPDEQKIDKYSVFSISIGKQIIPSREMVTSGFAFEPSFSLKNYFKGKAENLLQSGESQAKEEEVSDLLWNFEPTKTEDQFATDETLSEEISKEVQDFSWDFGNNWKRELQEDDILSIEPSLEDVVEQPLVQEEEPTLTQENGWNFGEDEVRVNENREEIVDAKAQTKIEEVDFSKLHEKMNNDQPAHEYQEVSSKTKELSIDLSEFDKIFEPKEHEDEDEIESSFQADFPMGNEPLVTKNEFVHVRSTTEFVLTQEQEALLAENDPFSSFTVESEAPTFTDYSFDPPTPISEIETQDEKNSAAEFTFPDEDNLLPLEEPEDDNKLSEVQHEKGSKFWGIVSAFLMAAIFLFLYWKMYGIPVWLHASVDTTQLVKRKPAVVEREYDIPVTYPYEVKITEAPKVDHYVESKKQGVTPSKEDIEVQETPLPKKDLEASDIFSKNNPNNRLGASLRQTPVQLPASKSKTHEVNVPEKKKETVVSKKPVIDKSKLVRDNIYLEGSSYVVQLSSWKSESIADQEVARLKNKGIKAYKTSAVVPQKGGTWYRVKVGGFSSAEAANNFYKSIK